MKKLKQILNFVPNKYKVIILLAIICILVWIGIKLWDKDIDTKRLEIYNTAHSNSETLSWELETKINEVEKLFSEYLYWKKCQKENSNTGKILDCNSLILPPVDVKLIDLMSTWKTNTWSLSIQSPTKWRVNKQGKSKSKEELKWDSFDEIVKNHWLPIDWWYDMEKKYKVKKEVALCIAWADSWLGTYLKTKNNIWNVGNNDRWNKVSYKTIENWIEAIFKVLNNKYLKNKQTIWSLSFWWWGKSPVYATSTENWNINVINCLSTINWVQVNEDYKIRL